MFFGKGAISKRTLPSTEKHVVKPTPAQKVYAHLLGLHFGNFLTNSNASRSCCSNSKSASCWSWLASSCSRRNPPQLPASTGWSRFFSARPLDPKQKNKNDEEMLTMVEQFSHCGVLLDTQVTQCFTCVKILHNDGRHGHWHHMKVKRWLFSRVSMIARPSQWARSHLHKAHLFPSSSYTSRLHISEEIAAHMADPKPGTPLGTW